MKPSNPSIERTFPGKPGAASHLKRYTAPQNIHAGHNTGIEHIKHIRTKVF